MSRKHRDDTETADTELPGDDSAALEDETQRGTAADAPDDPDAARGELPGPRFIPSNVTPQPGVPDEARTAPDPDEGRRGEFLPDGGYYQGAVHQQVDPITGTASAAQDPIAVSNDELLSINLNRAERVVLLEALGALFTLHGRGQFAGDRPLPEAELRALGDKLRGV